MHVDIPPFQNLNEWLEKYPALRPVVALQPHLWLNPNLKHMSQDLPLPFRRSDMDQGRAFLEKYAGFIARIFPETAAAGGHIVSPLREIPAYRDAQNRQSATPISGRLFLKCDNALPVAGSIKARGGFFEVLKFAHKLAVREGFIREEEAADFTLPKLRQLFAQYTIGVGSTGNLGLSIGIISAQLGFRVKVYMSQDAKAWKKDLLRQKGAEVIEIADDFGAAVSKGRRETHSNPYGYFVDDENSSQLFLGYSQAAFELQRQLQEQHITVDAGHPLFVYSPCGVGGSPGGVMFGLKTLFGDAVHSFFAEPTHSPSVLTGLITGKKEKICVQDFGIDNLTEADGLAVGRPSAFASGVIHKLVSGIFTVEDERLYEMLQSLYEQEQIFIEPSATAGLAGPVRVLSSGYLEQHHICPENVTHVAWSTGGDLVPAATREAFLKRGK